MNIGGKIIDYEYLENGEFTISQWIVFSTKICDIEDDDEFLKWKKQMKFTFEVFFDIEDLSECYFYMDENGNNIAGIDFKRINDALIKWITNWNSLSEGQSKLTKEEIMAGADKLGSKLGPELIIAELSSKYQIRPNEIREWECNECFLVLKYMKLKDDIERKYSNIITNKHI